MELNRQNIAVLVVRIVGFFINVKRVVGLPCIASENTYINGVCVVSGCVEFSLMIYSYYMYIHIE